MDQIRIWNIGNYPSLNLAGLVAKIFILNGAVSAECMPMPRNAADHKFYLDCMTCVINV